MYDFDKVIDRRASDSVKWSINEKLFGEQDIISAWVADMDFAAPDSVLTAIKERAGHGVFGYPTRAANYYEPIISWMERRHNWKIETDWLTHTPGVVPGIMLSVLAYTQPGDKIIIQPPVYPPFFSVVTNNKRQLLLNPLQNINGKYQMDLVRLEEQIDAQTKMLILCSPHNPVGRVWTKEELLHLGELCLRKNIIMVVDEIHHDLILHGGKHFLLANLDSELAQNTVTLIAASKTFNIAGFYSAAAIIPNKKLREQFNTMRNNLCLESTNIFGIIALETAYRTGEEWLAKLLDYLQGNLEFLLKYFAEHIPQIKPVCPEGTFLLWLDCRDLRLNDQELKAWMYQKARVAMNPGTSFGVEGSGFLRLNFACPRTTLVEIVQRIEQVV
jgi:cystathionine beta-lyase